MALPPPPSSLLTLRQAEAVARLERFIDEQLDPARQSGRGPAFGVDRLGRGELVIRLPEAVDADVADELQRRYLGAGWTHARIVEQPGLGWVIRLEALVDIHLNYALTGGPR